MKAKMDISRKIEKYREEIRRKNCKNFQLFALGGSIITGCILLFGILLLGRIRFVTEYLFFFIYMVFLYLLSVYCNKNNMKHIVCLYYFALLPIYICGILMGTFFDRGRPAITIIVLLCVLTLFIIDKPWRIFLYVFFISLLFCVCDFFAKDSALFATDLINLLIYDSIGIGVNYFSLKDRVESVENFVLVREKSERDAMTSLLNRSAGEQKVKHFLREKKKGAFIIFDIDHFKNINDTFGHQVGDEIICQVTKEIQDVFRSGDVVWRLGGDEFAVYAVGLFDERIIEKKFSLLNERLSVILSVPAACTCVSISAGCTIWQKKEMDFEDLYRSSDKALYRAKTSRKCGFIVKC